MVMPDNATEKYTLSAIRHVISTSSKMRGQAKKQLDKYFAAIKKIQIGSTQRFKKKNQQKTKSKVRK